MPKMPLPHWYKPSTQSAYVIWLKGLCKTLDLLNITKMTNSCFSLQLFNHHDIFYHIIDFLIIFVYLQYII